MARGRPDEEIRAEMARCEVRCANCHRRVTAQRAGWTRVTGRLTAQRRRRRALPPLDAEAVARAD